MTDLSRTLERSGRHAIGALGLAMVVLAWSIGGATGDGADGPRPPTPNPSPQPGQIAPAALRSGDGPGSIGEPAPSSPVRTPPVSATPGATAKAPATPDPARRVAPVLDPPPRSGRFAIDLFDDEDFVSQARSDWCVPASIIAMIRMIGLEGDRARPTQRALDRLARKLSTPRLRGAGSEPEGWAGTLNKLGYGPYEVRAERTRGAAIEAAARALRLTGRPVGLLMWRGAHAWVMSGFRATADPAYTDEFDVTHVYVVDPWYPRVSSIWGKAQPPGARVPVRRLAEDFLAWRRPAVRYPEKDGRFVLVVPVADAGTSAVGVDPPP